MCAQVGLCIQVAPIPQALYPVHGSIMAELGTQHICHTVPEPTRNRNRSYYGIIPDDNMSCRFIRDPNS